MVTSGALLATTSGTSRRTAIVHVWDMSAEKELYRLKHYSEVKCVSFHNDLIITLCYDSLRIWKKTTGELLHTLMHKGGNTFDISPDGTMIAVAHSGNIYMGFPGGVTIWSLTNFNKITELELDSVFEVYFQTNKKIIATVHSNTSKNGQIYLITAY